jgi:hypothetical protein
LVDAYRIQQRLINHPATAGSILHLYQRFSLLLLGIAESSLNAHVACQRHNRPFSIILKPKKLKKYNKKRLIIK